MSDVGARRALVAIGALALLAIGGALAAPRAEAHGGGLNRCGCHHDRRTGECHCHRDLACGCECQADRCA